MPPRRKSPAVIHREAIARLEDADEADLEGIPGWEQFTMDEKIFLTVYPYFPTLKQALKHVNRGDTWLVNHRRQNPQFAQAIEHRRYAKLRLAKSWYPELLANSMYVFYKILHPQSQASLSMQLDAAKHVWSMAKGAHQIEKESPTVITKSNIMMFQGASSNKLLQKRSRDLLGPAQDGLETSPQPYEVEPSMGGEGLKDG
jgi:hypothetical protein